MEPKVETPSKGMGVVESVRAVVIFGGFIYVLTSLVRGVRRMNRGDPEAFMDKRSMDGGFFDGTPAVGPFREASVDRVMRKHARKVRKCGITKRALKQGMAVEREHRDVTRGSIEKTARIAMAHLCERPDYYERLKKVEGQR